MGADLGRWGGSAISTGDKDLTTRATGAVDEDASARYRIEAVTRAARMLSALRVAKNLDTRTLAAEAEAPIGFARPALETLARHGLARASETDPDTWSLGLAWLGLASVGRGQIDLREIAAPIMRRMRDDVDETVILAVRRGLRRRNIDYAESAQPIRRIRQPDFETPLHVGAASRALLSGLSPTELQDYFTEVAQDGDTTVNIAAVTAALETIRRQGYVKVSREFTPDMAAVSSPVYGATGDVVASLTISGPDNRFTPTLDAACIKAVKSGAREISRLLGFDDDDERAPANI